METINDYIEMVAEDIVYFMSCNDITEVTESNREEIRDWLTKKSGCREAVTKNDALDEATVNDLIKGQWRLIGLAMHEMGLTGGWLARADAYKIDNLLRHFVFDDAVSEAMRELYVINDEED